MEICKDRGILTVEIISWSKLDHQLKPASIGWPFHYSMGLRFAHPSRAIQKRRLIKGRQ